MIRIEDIQGSGHSVELRKLVVKVGSAVIAGEDDGADRAVMRGLARSISGLMKSGVRVILVSSGAIGIGRSRMGFAPQTLPDRQALAAIGQVGLMHNYHALFAKLGLRVAQVLLSRDDMADRRRYLNARMTLDRLLELGVLPIINENDTVTVEELKFGDNDELSARVALKMNSDMLAILSKVDGLHVSDPGAHYAGGGREAVASVIEADDKTIMAMVGASKSALGTGGMAGKLEAMRLAASAGVHAVLANGRAPKMLEKIITGKFRGTYMPPPANAARRQGRAGWLAIGGRALDRRLTVDAGAVRALVAGKKSLLAVGVTGVAGAFEPGDVVEVFGPDGARVARGLVNYSSGDLARIKGLKSAQIRALLGAADYEDVINRDNLAVLD